ncbi:MAG: PASTA domain-containing protein [Marinifilaceae bacterium]|nr:PASTA domain-containing protein [Marinifilaceae bacterium]
MNINKNLQIILLNILLAVVLIIGLIFITLKSIDNYTLHGEVITVPEFIGLSQDEAAKLAHSMQLKTTISDSLHASDAAPGAIIDQYPASGAQVKEGRAISLIINTVEEEKIAMPQLKNVSLRQSMNKLTSLGFRIGRITYEQSEYKNLVLGYTHLDDTLEAGDLLTKGAVINLILGTGRNIGKVTVPDVRGSSLKTAYQTLLNNHLNSVYVDKNGSPLIGTDYDNTHFVFMQEPKSDTLLDAGSTIFLFSTDNKEELNKLIRELDSLQMEEQKVIDYSEYSEENDPGLNEVAIEDEESEFE